MAASACWSSMAAACWSRRPVKKENVCGYASAPTIFLIAREAPRAISANNILPVTVSEVRLEGARAEVVMQCGAVRLVARITAASVQRLALAAGVSAFAVIKSVTVEGNGAFPGKV